jgi:hypothetical protein
MIAKNLLNNDSERSKGSHEFLLLNFFPHEENIIDENKTIIEKEGYFNLHDIN